MSPYVAFILGILVVLVPFIIFYVLSMNFTSVSNAYQDIFCNQAI